MINNEENICDDCECRDETVKKENELNLCGNCSLKRKKEAEKVLEDLQHLAEEVEERLQAIENTERELDQWRDQQLQKNRDFWDGLTLSSTSLPILLFLSPEYRRQVENFSACRIRTLQYEYTIRQMKTEKILKRLKKGKYLSEHWNELDQRALSDHLIHLIQSEPFQLFLANYQEKNRDDFIEQLAELDQLVFPNEELFLLDEHFDE